MIQFIKNNILPTGGIVAAALAMILYWSYFGGANAPLLSQTDATSSVSKELLLALSHLHTLKLNQDIFTDPVFVSLNDFGVQIPEQDVGRGNPFAPF